MRFFLTAPFLLRPLCYTRGKAHAHATHSSNSCGVFRGCYAFPQTYTPKNIKLQGADALDRAEIMGLIDLKPGAPLTKEQIEAAMQRLSDSGLFTDMSYRVGPDALVFALTPAEGAQALSVHYGNLVCWKPGELEPLVEARVPGFHGSVPLTGPLTEKAEAALVTLLAEKDSSAHTVAYAFQLVPGPVYTLAGVDSSALPGSVQSRFASAFHGRPGVLADATLRDEMVRALQSAGAGSSSIQGRQDRTAHTVTYVLVPKGRSSVGSTASD